MNFNLCQGFLHHKTRKWNDLLYFHCLCNSLFICKFFFTSKSLSVVISSASYYLTKNCWFPRLNHAKMSHFTFERYAYICISVLLCCFLLQQIAAEGMKCEVVLDGSDKWESANEQCVKTNKVDESKLENVPLNATLDEFDFDDNCFIECIYTKVGIVKPDGSLDKTKTADIFKGNMTKEMFEMSVSIWDTCIDEIDRIAALTEKLKTPCKKLSLHDYCFNKMVSDAGLLEMEC